MTSVLTIGFLLGMRHALEADHLAAVAALASGDGRPRLLRMGMFWALGHSMTLVILGSVILLTNSVVPPALEASLECLVGLLLIALGVGVVHRVVTGRVDSHAHALEDKLHLQTGSHSNADQRGADHHDGQTTTQSRRAVAIGVIHGLAGSAALILLTLATIDSVWTGVAYLVIFSIGSIVGMALLSSIIALPLQLLAKRLTLQYKCLLVLVGAWSAALGALVVYENTSATIFGLGVG